MSLSSAIFTAGLLGAASFGMGMLPLAVTFSSESWNLCTIILFHLLWNEQATNEVNGGTFSVVTTTSCSAVHIAVLPQLRNCRS